MGKWCAPLDIALGYMMANATKTGSSLNGSFADDGASVYDETSADTDSPANDHQPGSGWECRQLVAYRLFPYRRNSSRHQAVPEGPESDRQHQIHE